MKYALLIAAVVIFGLILIADYFNKDDDYNFGQ